MNLQKHLRNSYPLFVSIFLTASVFTGCSKKKISADYSARVNDAYVTEADAKDYLDSAYSSPVLRTEYFQNWVKTELLYQKAEKEGITHDKQFQTLLDRSKKEIAASLLLKKITDEFSVTLSEDDLKKYYDQHNEYFRINDRGIFIRCD